MREWYFYTIFTFISGTLIPQYCNNDQIILLDREN
jgi:hypothetical protein